MPWKMIFFLFIMLIFVLFIAFNVDNSSDISFGFASFTDVPIFISLFIAFSAGVVITIPMILMKGRKKRVEKSKKKQKRTDDTSPLPSEEEMQSSHEEP